MGARSSVEGADQARRAASWVLMCRILYRFLASIARLAMRSGRSKDLEIIALRPGDRAAPTDQPTGADR